MRLPNGWTPQNGDPAKPFVLMLHGDVGDTRNMANPGVLGFNYHHSGVLPSKGLGWYWWPGGPFPWSMGLDPWKSVESWFVFLKNNGYANATYNQVNNAGSLMAGPVDELASVMQYLRANYPNQRVIILAHSRGGLLARAYINKYRTSAEVGQISKVITLHTAHQGSMLPSIANELRDRLNAIDQMAWSYPAVTAVTGFLRNLVWRESFLEQAVGSPFLTALANDEAQNRVTSIQFHTFGGTSIRWARFNAWWYSPMSQVAQWHYPPYYHSVYAREVYEVSPLLNRFQASLPPVPELIDGQGDMCVAESRSRLPYAASHRVNRLNHAEALWDNELKKQVLPLLS